MSEFETFSPEEYTYDFDYTYTFDYRRPTGIISNDYEMIFTSHTEYNNFIQAASRSPLETLEMFTKRKIQELETGIAEGDDRPVYRSIPCLTFDSEGAEEPVYRSIPCLTFCTEDAYGADGADGTDGADGADSPYPDSSCRDSSHRSHTSRRGSSSSYYSSSSSPSCPSCPSGHSSPSGYSFNPLSMASIGTHMFDNPGTTESATTAYVSRERLAALEFLEKNISTIISEQVRKHYDGYTGSSNTEE